MSFLYDPRTKKPQVWTYPVFVLLAAGVFYGFYAYGEHKSRNQIKIEENAVVERNF
jgi:hypothetical protein